MEHLITPTGHMSSNHRSQSQPQSNTGAVLNQRLAPAAAAAAVATVLTEMTCEQW